MNDTTLESAPDAAPTSSRAQQTKQKILATATEMFYAAGIKAVSADRISEHVGVTRVTFYRHFPTKTDLVVAYIEEQASQERAALVRTVADQKGEGALLAVADMIGTAACMPGFRGCPFINAAAELPDATDPVRLAVERHRTWTRSFLIGLASDAGVSDAAATGGQVMMLRDGAMVDGYLEDPQEVARGLRQAVKAVLTAGSVAHGSRREAPPAR